MILKYAVIALNKMSFLICVSVAFVCFNDNFEVFTVEAVRPKSVIVWVSFAVASLATNWVLLPAPLLFICSCP